MISENTDLTIISSITDSLFDDPATVFDTLSDAFADTEIHVLHDPAEETTYFLKESDVLTPIREYPIDDRPDPAPNPITDPKYTVGEGITTTTSPSITDMLDK